MPVLSSRGRPQQTHLENGTCNIKESAMTIFIVSCQLTLLALLALSLSAYAPVTGTNGGVLISRNNRKATGA